ncbi:MAG: RagB/SusD family nutrient uptake outer membrane protein [Bacteroidota bacterium]
MMLASCKKLLEIPLPATKIAAEGAYVTDRAAAATNNNVFGNITNSLFFDGAQSIGFKVGLYTDELKNLNSLSTLNTAYYSSTILSADGGPLWSFCYKQLSNVNLTIEGVRASNTLLFKNQWLGEALFNRAFLHFYLVNLYGDAVITTTSDFLILKDLGRSPKADVYKQIIADLKEAESLLANEYKDGTGVTTATNRARPNKFAAKALLAKAYLYTGDWVNAEAMSTEVIGAGAVYKLLLPADIDKVFLAASQETIFALQPIGVNFERDFTAYTNNMPAVLPVAVPPAAARTFESYVGASLTQSLLDAFEKNTATLVDDRRRTFWVRSSIKPANGAVPAETKYFPNKYKSSVAGAEYIVIMRLAEQYLIRAEARAMQNNFSGAKEDINIIRTRAGLSPTTAENQPDLIKAILNERRVEFFTENGHRLFDLRRTGNLDAVMNNEIIAKGTGFSWNTFRQYWPIAQDDLLSGTNLIQTAGY